MVSVSFAWLYNWSRPVTPLHTPHPTTTVRGNPSQSHWRVSEAFKLSLKPLNLCLSGDFLWCCMTFEVFEPSDPQTQSLWTLRPRDTPRPFLLFSLIPFISLVILFAFRLCLTYIDIQLTFDSTLYVGLYIRLCQQDDPHSFLFGSPARYVMYSSSLLCNWTSLDLLLVLFKALECVWCFEYFFRPQLPLQ